MKLNYCLICLLILLWIGVIPVGSQTPTGSSPNARQKFALLVGIDKYAKEPLEGCAKDARDVQGLLNKSYGFAKPNTHLLLDGEATRAKILGALEKKEAEVKSGDLFVFYYSGHGTLFPDEKSGDLDETEVIIDPATGREGKYDSALCPVNVGFSALTGKPWRNLILDDELYARFSRFTKKGCAVVFIADSCNSGTIGKGERKVIPKFLSMEDALGSSLKEIPTPQISRTIKPPDMRGQYLILSSSKDSQFSGATEGGSLFTRSLLETLRQTPNRNYKDLYNIVRKKVLKDSENTQEPRLDKRFYRGSLEATFLSFLEGIPAASEAVAAPLNVRFLVTDIRDKPVKDAVIKISSGGVDYTDKTNSKGVSLLKKIKSGNYAVTIQQPKYLNLKSDIEIVESPFNPGQADLAIILKSK